MNKRLILLVAVAIILIAAIVIGLSSQLSNQNQGSLSNSNSASTNQSPNITVTCTWIKYTQMTYPQYPSIIDYPSEGNMYILVNMTIKNNGYESINTNPNYFFVTDNNIKYNYNSGTFSLGQWNTVDVLNSGTFNGVLMFEVPKTMASFKLSYEMPFQQYNVNYNPQ